MSMKSTQQEEQGSEPIEQKIERVATKTKRTRELKADQKSVEKEKQRAESKNRAFTDLTKTIRQVEEQYEQLDRWQKFKTEIENYTGKTIVDNEAVDTDREIDEISRVLSEFTDKRWKDFEDEQDIRELISELEDYRSSLRESTTTYRNAVQDHCRSQLEAVRRTQTALRIPDIGEENAMHRTKLFESYLENVVQEKGNNTAARWRELTEEFEELEVDLEGVQKRFNLSEPTMSHIERFLEGETVSLSDFNETVLNEIQKFEELSDNLSVRFEE